MFISAGFQKVRPSSLYQKSTLISSRSLRNWFETLPSEPKLHSMLNSSRVPTPKPCFTGPAPVASLFISHLPLETLRLYVKVAFDTVRSLSVVGWRRTRSVPDCFACSRQETGPVVTHWLGTLISGWFCVKVAITEPRIRSAKE